MLKVVQNDPDVPPGLILDVLQEEDISFQLIPIHAEDYSWDLTAGCGVIVLGGIMSVRDIIPFPFLQELKVQVREVVQRGIPYLGVCLGGQLLAEVLDARVHLQRSGERGCQEISLTEEGERDPLFVGMPNPFQSFQWHSDSFDLPSEAVHLAQTATCQYQAFRWGRAAYGIQFHPEVTGGIVSNWCSVTEREETGILEAFKAADAAYNAASLTLIHNFLGIIRSGRSRKIFAA
jgi:GMP synthase (glutamine-hydrolysing)